MFEEYEWKCTCAESSEEILFVVYDPNGSAITHGEIVQRLNEGIELVSENKYLKYKVSELERENRQMESALERIQQVKGCECDSYHGFVCSMCQVRKIAHDAIVPF